LKVERSVKGSGAQAENTVRMQVVDEENVVRAYKGRRTDTEFNALG
jgi:hypothetical protein